jgi:hypothetical protein
VLLLYFSLCFCVSVIIDENYYDVDQHTCVYIVALNVNCSY